MTCIVKFAIFLSMAINEERRRYGLFGQQLFEMSCTTHLSSRIWFMMRPVHFYGLAAISSRYLRLTAKHGITTITLRRDL